MSPGWRRCVVAIGLLTAGAWMAATCVSRPAAAEDAAELNVVVTIKPIHALVAGVMEGVGTPHLLVSGATSPHTFSLLPADARALHAAQVFFRVSPAVEPFTQRVVAALPDRVRTVTLADAPGVTKLALRRSGAFEAHDHDGHGHDEESDPDAHGHGHGQDAQLGDGHVWLDPDNAKRMVDDIALVLSEAAPAHAERFAANAQRVNAGIARLDAEIATALADVKQRPYVVFHDAYQYFERHYGLAPVGAITVGPEVQPGARRISEIRAKIVSLGAVCVFTEPQYSARAVAALTEGTQARAGVLDPEGALVPAGREAWTQLMRNLATGLKGCLEGER